MKKIYPNPTVELTTFSANDIITLSAGEGVGEAVSKSWLTDGEDITLG